MVSKKPSDTTNDIGEDTHTEVSNKESPRILNPEHTKGQSKKQKIEQTHEQVTEDVIPHPDLINPLDNTRIDVKSGLNKDSQRLKSDEHEFEYDAVVLGAGPAGEAAAMKLSKSGKKVAVIDPREQVGGNCAHVGTIPSKALRQSVFNLINFRRDPLFTKAMDSNQVPLNKVLANARQVIRRQVSTHTRFYERNQIEVIQGWASFVDAHTLRIETDDNVFETITFNKAIITVGSRPYRPDILDFDHPRVFDSDKILQMDYVVKKNHHLWCWGDWL